MLILLQDREDTGRRAVPRPSAADGTAADAHAVAIDVCLLLRKGDDDDDRVIFQFPPAGSVVAAGTEVAELTGNGGRTR